MRALIVLCFLLGACGGASDATRCVERSTPVEPAPVEPEACSAPLPEGPEAVLLALARSTCVPDSWLTDAFRGAVSSAQLSQIASSLRESLGAVTGVEVDGAAFRVAYERGVVPTQLALDGEGRISGLFFSPPVSSAMSLEDAARAFDATPGRHALLVTNGTADAIAQNADEPLAVGSAFKLAILAVIDDMAARRRNLFEQVIRLEPRLRSLPSGRLQDFPEGSPLTIHTLAALMISESDNTATDRLLDFVGRAAVERQLPRNAPLLSTRELFVLKSPRNAALLARYRAADVAARRAMLDEIDAAPLPDVSDFADPVVSNDVEWFATARELCALLDRVHSDPVMHINPGLAQRDQWAEIAFKGGSEAGVLNLSTRVVGQDGVSHCVIATWNADVPLDEPSLFIAYSAVLGALGR